MESYALLVAATLNAGTVLAIASLGLLINEKAGIVNLGAEGMMLCAAIAGFATVVHTGSDTMGFVAGMGAGALMAAIFGAGFNNNLAQFRSDIRQATGRKFFQIIGGIDCFKNRHDFPLITKQKSFTTEDTEGSLRKPGI